MTRPIFVFGSNQRGRHGKGAALHAYQNCGAIMNQAEGRQGDSYAIPTKDRWYQPLPLEMIEPGVKTFLEYACLHPELDFQLTPIGCGLAGYQYKDIAPMFFVRPDNVLMPAEFRLVLGELFLGPQRECPLCSGSLQWHDLGCRHPDNSEKAAE